MHPRIQIVVDVIKANPQQSLGLSELARLAGLSSSHLCCLFKSQIGTSPCQYVLAARMERAAELLATTPLSIKHIMIEAGFTDKTLFVRHFKKAHGVTPSQYRAHRHEPTQVRSGRGRVS